MRGVDNAWQRKQRRRRVFLFSAICAVALVIVGVPTIFMRGKAEYRQAVKTRTDAARQFDKTTSDTVVKDIDNVLRQSGACGAGCATHDPATFNWQWQIVTENGALLTDLYAWQPRQQSPERYRLIVYSLSTRPDGKLDAESRLAQTLTALLERFGYPDPAQPYVDRDQESENSHYQTIGPKRTDLIWKPFPGKDRMRTEWLFNMLRKGPFAEKIRGWQKDN